jgi:hypothetical protein
MFLLLLLLLCPYMRQGGWEEGWYCHCHCHCHQAWTGGEAEGAATATATASKTLHRMQGFYVHLWLAYLNSREGSAAIAAVITVTIIMFDLEGGEVQLFISKPCFSFIEYIA